MAEGKVLQRDFTLYKWIPSIPLTDDVYLGMQAEHLAVIDMSVLRPLESTALDEHNEASRVSEPTLSKLSALSQMWVFALYEFLRTWNQRAKRLIDYADRLEKCATAAEREEYSTKITEEAKSKARLVKLAPVFYIDQVAKVGDKNFMIAIRNYKIKTEHLFKEVSSIRMPLAKHEVPGKEKLLAEAPGLDAISAFTGSVYWQVVASDETTTIIERRSLADAFLGISSWHEDVEAALPLAEKQIAREKKRRRKEKRAAKASALEATVAPKGEWPFKDELIVVQPESRRRRRGQDELIVVQPESRRRRRGRRGGRRNRKRKE